MRITWSTGWISPLAEMVLYLWVAAGVYVVGSSLFTNPIRSREAFRIRLLDRSLLLGGYFLLFAQVPLQAPRHLHFLPVQQSLQIAGVVFAGVGALLVIWARACLGRYWSGVVALKQDHRLIQSGPYRLVRHPLYTGLILLAFGWCLCVTTWSSLLGALLFVTCFERRAHKEDALLAGEFGAEFENYRQRTGRLVPRRPVTCHL